MDKCALTKDTDSDYFSSIKSGNDYSDLGQINDNTIHDPFVSIAQRGTEEFSLDRGVQGTGYTKKWWIKWVVVAVIFVAVCILVATICGVYMVHIHSDIQIGSSLVHQMCLSTPCQNDGICSDKNGQITCSCQTGYTGAICETDIDECVSNPCQNEAVCVDDINGYSCNCRNGYTGIYCHNDIDECASSPCQNNGTCLHQTNNFTCHCQLGYTGAICETDVNECDSSPCQNGATCLDHLYNFTCHCQSGYTGPLCEIDIDECSSNPCQNAGLCVDDFNGFICHCHAGDTGKLCENDLIVNVALDEAVSCQVSTTLGSYTYGCDNAIDEITDPGHHTQWTSEKSDSQRWIKIILPRTAHIIKATIWFMCHTNEQVTRVRLEFSSATYQDMRRTCNGGTSWLQCSNQPGEIYHLQPAVNTTSVTVFGKEGCPSASTGAFGLREVELWGYYLT